MKRYKFKAKIEAGVGGGAFVFFPYDVEKEFCDEGEGSGEGDAWWRALCGFFDGVWWAAPYAGRA